MQKLFFEAAPQGLQMCIEWYGGVCKFNLFRPSNHCLLINKPDLIKVILDLFLPYLIILQMKGPRLI